MLVGLLVLASSCKKESTPAAATQTGSKILVNGQDAGINFKSTLSGQTTVWIASSDQVGIYSDLARTAAGGLGSLIANAVFTADASTASSTFTGTMYWGTGTATEHKFYAYYPYSDSAGSDATAVPVSLAAAQIQSAANNNAHIGALDFMVATPATVTSPANTNAVGSIVNLRYNHLFTILEFQIKGSGTTLKAIKFSGNKTLAFSRGTIDITQVIPATDVAYTFASQTGTTTQAVVTLTSAATLTSTNTDTKVYMVINPGTQMGNFQISVSTDGNTWKYLAKTALAGGFLRGNKYVVSIDADAATDNVVDIESNSYGTVTIGTQVWMAENLKTTKYNDGTAIPNDAVVGASAASDAAWALLRTDAYCWYNNDINNKPIYGALYNWYAVNTGKLCPTGWHVPTDSEWTTLTTYLGGLAVAGGKLKENGTTHWNTPNTGADNSSRFTALPGGNRQNIDGMFYTMGKGSGWWGSTAGSGNTASSRILKYDSATVPGPPDDGNNKWNGFYVRCVRD